MLKKIISGGQTGADRAALDVALMFKIPHGGWIPISRKTNWGFGLYPKSIRPININNDRKDSIKQNIPNPLFLLIDSPPL